MEEEPKNLNLRQKKSEWKTTKKFEIEDDQKKQNEKNKVK